MKTHPSIRKGFTLIELLTAMAITTVIIGVLIGATRMSMDAWKDSRDKARASRLAKESIELMARDLEGIVIRSGNVNEWLSIRMDANEANGPTNAEMKNPLEFVFFSAATDRYDGEIGVPGTDMGGDISTVIYKLVYKDQFEGISGGAPIPVFSLYRQLINPDETFGDPADPDKGYLAKDDIQGLVEPEDVINANNFVAENVFNLTVTLIFEYTNTTTNILEQKRLPIMSNGSGYTEVRIKGNEVLTPGGTTLPADARLAGAELGILVLSDSGMRGLNKKQFPNPAAFAKFVKENSHYFTKSVVMPRP